jgi:Uma2 family endonuclease
VRGVLLRIGVPATELVTYPDVSIVCGSLEKDPIDRTGHTVVNPKVLIEVLSPSTADYDRGEKLVHYKQLPSLEAIVLFDHAAERAELWHRAGTDWRCS